MSTPAPLRVLHLDCTRHFGGVERYLLAVGPRLADHGVEVTIAGGPQLVAAAAELGLLALPASRPWSALRSLLAARSADVVHAHLTASELLAAACRPVRRGRLVATRHFAARRGSRPWSRAAGRLAARAIDLELAVSSAVAEAVEGDPVVLTSGVASAPAAPLDDPVVLVVSRLEREKAVEVALAAWDASGLVDHGWRLLVAGAGEEEARLRAVAGAGTTFLGHRGDIDALLAGASVVLAPTPNEAFGLAVVEAMAAGVPVVAAAGGGHLETVGRAAPELLFPPGDVAGAARRLRRLALDVAERRRAGAALRDTQQAHFDLDAHASRLAELYRAVVTGRSSPSTLPERDHRPLTA